MIDQIRSVAGLQTAVSAGQRVKYLYFWGHQDAGRGYLSQWYPSAFTVDGVRFASAEHYMMWRKAVLFDDTETAGGILAAGHPHQAKKLGGRVARFDQQVWDEHRTPIVVAGNVAKFGSDPAMRDYLLGTGDRVLVEASPVDRIWGIGLAADDERAANPLRWRGLNLLGFALMEVRARLRS